MSTDKKRKLFLLLGILAYIPVAAMLDPLIIPHVNSVIYMVINGVLLLAWGFIVGKIVNKFFA
jgi:hypothetical protein